MNKNGAIKRNKIILFSIILLLLLISVSGVAYYIKKTTFEDSNVAGLNNDCSAKGRACEQAKEDEESATFFKKAAAWKKRVAACWSYQTCCVTSLGLASGCEDSCVATTGYNSGYEYNGYNEYMVA